jgi:hypothetical protein
VRRLPHAVHAEGATKISDHWVRSPLLNVNRACQTCHRASENELVARVGVIQDRNYALMQRGGAAIVELIDTIVAAKAAGVSPEALAPALAFQRKAQWRLDFIAAENSMGFHAPQEAARILGEALDDARRGQLAARALLPAGAVVPTPAAPRRPRPRRPRPRPRRPRRPLRPLRPRRRSSATESESEPEPEAESEAEAESESETETESEGDRDASSDRGG